MAVNILLADDHRMVREGLKQLLETDSEINVVAEAGDGYECLNLTNKTKPDIVLLDINMPNMDGIQVLNIMKQQKRHLNITSGKINLYRKNLKKQTIQIYV